jgi:lysophospholipase L1-like esterase
LTRPADDAQGPRPLAAVVVALALALGLVAVTCSTANDAPPRAPVASAAPVVELAPSARASASALVVVDAGVDAAAEAPIAVTGELGHFYAALRGLEQKTRAEHVRVEWLGDSHGASDFWSGRLRTALQKRFGDGGPGFVHLGYRAYRHEGVKMTVEGKWKSNPRGPSTILKTGDGVFGLGGMLWSSEDGAAHAVVALDDPALTGKVSWDLCYKLFGRDDGLAVTATGGARTLLRAKNADELHKVRHVGFTTTGAGAQIGVTPAGGHPELCGVVVEADAAAQPGVVLDTLAINGARMATPLAWEESSFAAELARRAPSLVVLEFGTNEAGDVNVKPAAYAAHLTKVMARIRRVVADVDCLVLAPTDRADAEERTPLVRDALRDGAAANGCAFFDTYAVMGGKGSIDAWRGETPPRAAKDGIHLTFRGYHEVGDKLVAQILAGYDGRTPGAAPP